MQSYFWLCRSLGCHLIYAHVNWQTRRATHLAQFNSIKLLMGDKYIHLKILVLVGNNSWVRVIFGYIFASRRNSPSKQNINSLKKAIEIVQIIIKKPKRKCSFGKIPCSNKLTYYNIPNIAQTFIYSKCLVLSIFCVLCIYFIYLVFIISLLLILFIVWSILRHIKCNINF